MRHSRPQQPITALRHTTAGQKLSRNPRELSISASSRYTVMCWVLLVSSPTSTYNQITSLNDSIAIGGSPAEIDGVDFIRQTGSTYGFSWYVNGVGAGFVEQIVTSGIAINTWYHVAFQRISSTVLWGWLNGRQVVTVTTGNVGTRTINALDIGGVWSPVQETIDGRIAEHRAWNRALSAAEIRAEMMSAIPQSLAGLASWYQFAPGAARLLDSSGAGRHLTATGALSRVEPGPAGLLLPAQPLTRSRLFVVPGVRVVSSGSSATVNDSGAGTDVASGVLATTQADAGSGAEALAAQHAATQADTGAGADAASGALASTQNDAGVGIDVLTAQAGATLADTGAGTDVTSGALAATLTDAGVGVDTVSTPGGGTASAGDTGAGVDAASGILAAAQADAGLGVDVASGLGVSSLIENASGIEAIGAALAAVRSDAGVGVDAASGLHAATRADAGAGTDALVAAIAALLAESIVVVDGVSTLPSLLESVSVPLIPPGGRSTRLTAGARATRQNNNRRTRFGQSE